MVYLPLSPPTAAPWDRIAQVSPPGPRHPASARLDTGVPGPVPQFPRVIPFAPCRYCPGSPLRKALQTRWAREWGHHGHRGRLSPTHPAPHQAAEEEDDEDEDDWWSKFYAATGDKAKSQRGTNRDRLKIYSCELEAVPEFEGLQDFCQTFPLYQPGGHPAAGEDPVPVGEFKGLFRVLCPLPPPCHPDGPLPTLGQRDQYVPNTLEPVFGRLFEVTGTIPLEKDLRVSLLDYDLLPPDQEIGTTTIDLENRLLSRFRAHCGLPTLYRTWVPLGWGYQGAWGIGVPGPEPRSGHGDRCRAMDPLVRPPPSRYELRCVVWNTRDMDLGDTNLVGQRMSDIYVTGWLDGLEEQRQRTDVHYRSLQGDGGFNWRFVFSFEYLAAEQLCVLPRKEHFWSLDETVLKVPPKLILQVWDNDKFSADDFLGVLELELTRLPQPAQHPQNCSQMGQGTPQNPAPHLPPITPLQGKLELSLELLTAKEAEERPAGKGREDPNMSPTLPAPVRPEWSFLWLQAPLRSLRYSIWRQHRCRISLGLALLLLLALVLAFIYAAPVSPGGTASPPISTLTSCKAPSELPFLPPCRVIWP
uniref:C2 domain-containing protein n=1 Tax=Buteo japonicus TaxID=224669 RepID=A0A8C0HPH1_9AVES